MTDNVLYRSQSARWQAFTDKRFHCRHSLPKRRNVTSEVGHIPPELYHVPGELPRQSEPNG